MAVWSPWRVLRERHDVILGLRRLPASTGGGVIYRDADGAVILIEADLRRVERKMVLAHELVHLERGGVIADVDQPPTWDAVVAREELRVDRIVAERMVPVDELNAWVESLDGEPVTVHDVAARFDVSEEVARLACAMAITDGLLRRAG